MANCSMWTNSPAIMLGLKMSIVAGLCSLMKYPPLLRFGARKRLSSPMTSLCMKNSEFVEQALPIHPFGTFGLLHDKGIE